MKILAFFIYILVFPFVAICQKDIKKELILISKEHALSNHYMANVTYKLKVDGKLYSEETATISRKDSLLSYKLQDLEIINNSKCKLFVNNISKEISVMPSEKINSQTLYRISIDTAIAEVSRFEYKDTLGNMGFVTMYFNTKAYEKIEILYTNNTYSVKSIKIYFSPLNEFAEEFGIGKGNANANLLFEVNINSFVQAPSFSESNFSESKYINISNNKVTLNNNFKTYELYDFLFTE